jgi:hypothetical protein
MAVKAPSGCLRSVATAAPVVHPITTRSKDTQPQLVEHIVYCKFCGCDVVLVLSP